MFDQHDDAASGTDDLPIWRFLSFAQFIDVLDRRSLYFTRIDTLDDPFAGSSDVTAASLRMLPEEVMRLAEQAAAPPPKMGRLERWWARKAQEGEQDNLVKTIRGYQPPALVWASCWHGDGAQKMALWKSYHADSKHIAIRSTIGKLRSALAANAPLPLTVDVVRYLDPASLADIADPSRRALAKSDALAHEQEVRAILTRIAGSGEGCLGRGCSVAIDTSAMIDQVAVSPAAEAWFHDLAGRAMRTYGLHINVAVDGEGRLALPDYTPERALPSSS